MVGESATIPPFTTIDGIPFCCNGIENCGIEAMHKTWPDRTIAQCLRSA